MGRAGVIGGVLACGLLTGWCASAWVAGRPGGPRPVAPRGPLGAGEQAVVDRFKEARPSVVFVTSLAFQRDFFSYDVQVVPTGSGSGFVWDAEGHIVTNFHVIEDSDQLEVTLSDHSTHRAKVVGRAPDKDLAVLKLLDPPANLRPIPLGTSADLQVGQGVLAIGNPFGLDQTLTTGIVSALGREIQSPTRRRISGVIQTDAAINPGNSGGPLLDSAGRLIGVNTAIQSPSGASAGIGFAVPVDTVNRVVPQLIARGTVLRPDLGFLPLSDPYARALDAPKGVVVGRVERGSPAARAGLQGLRQEGRRWALGDVVVGVNGKPIANLDQLLDAVEVVPLGSAVTLEVLRDRARIQLRFVLEAARN